MPAPETLASSLATGFAVAILILATRATRLTNLSVRAEEVGRLYKFNAYSNMDDPLPWVQTPI
jgi:hypothetical protein